MRYLPLTVFLLATLFAGSQARMFEPGLISNGGVFGFTLSPDGREAFFVFSNGGRDTMQLYHTVKRGKRWSKPQPWRWADARQRQIDPAFSPDGNTLLLNINGPGTRSFDIFASRRTDSGWSNPEPVAAVNSDSSDFFATMSRSGTIYFTRRLDGRNQVHVSRLRNGAYTLPVPLDSVVNGLPGGATNPFIDPDERYLLFHVSERPGVGDLYVSWRGDAGWTAPVALGSEVNSPISEFCPFVHGPGGYLYFARTEVQPGGRRTENIWRIRVKKVQALRKRPGNSFASPLLSFRKPSAFGRFELIL
ncbi:MAG: hypothetical protein EOO15_03795 [Chitinophagaceae bacterium]|nr:MAG: hypothetical protein EOO15_03795 [Chitinophagaceae bacterium]